MSQSPCKINEGSFLYQITFIYYTCFLLKTRTPCRSLDPGLERCAAGTGKASRVLGWVGLQASGERITPGTRLWASIELPRGQEQLLDLSRPLWASVSSSVNLCLQDSSRLQTP